MLSYSIALAAQCFASPDVRQPYAQPGVSAQTTPVYDSNQVQAKEILKDMLSYSGVTDVEAEVKMDLAMKILFQKSNHVVKYLSTSPSVLCSSNACNNQEPIYTPSVQHYSSIIDEPYYFKT
ncbi:hypothetical protein DSO57_1004003 [Entomophthora muscae]|uniref:Uncharacterized protein n=1 Tax=Entomophthora muscae TaxID=34485 RepID=A0ACC2SLD0_9FUNG|nr:hypothetical protein DSO57_1004003 [Entomophthora muscae]